VDKTGDGTAEGGYTRAVYMAFEIAIALPRRG
jgi:hypothetical protein